jgi:hypothetical protein
MINAFKHRWRLGVLSLLRSRAFTCMC